MQKHILVYLMVTLFAVTTTVTVNAEDSARVVRCDNLPMSPLESRLPQPFESHPCRSLHHTGQERPHDAPAAFEQRRGVCHSHMHPTIIIGTSN